MRFVVSGMCPSVEPAVCSRWTPRPNYNQRIREICQTRLRFGYRRIQVQLRREGWPINEKKTRRIYRELGLQLRNKTPKRRINAKLRDDRRPATRSNETWAMDFVHDQLAIGQRMRVLTIVDTFSRLSPALEPRFTFRGADVVDILEKFAREVGLPATIRVDQGTELVSRDLDLWLRILARSSTLGPATAPVIAIRIVSIPVTAGAPRSLEFLALYFRAQLVVRTAQPNMIN
jgi:transposase InsO family protein